MVEKGANSESNVNQSKSSLQNDPAHDPHLLNAEDLQEVGIDSKCKKDPLLITCVEGADEGADDSQNQGGQAAV